MRKAGRNARVAEIKVRKKVRLRHEEKGESSRLTQLRSQSLLSGT